MDQHWFLGFLHESRRLLESRFPSLSNQILHHGGNDAKGRTHLAVNQHSLSFYLRSPAQSRLRFGATHGPSSGANCGDVPSAESEVQDWAKARLAKSPRHQEWVKVKNGNREVNSFIVYPEVKTKATAVVVIHEIFGMSDWVQSLTDQLAEAGYVAIAPDLLSGMGPSGGGTSSFTERNAVGQAIRDLPPDQITADLNAVADYVAKLPAANGKVAVAGYCWGGSQTFRYATNNPNLKAAFVFYGSAPGKQRRTR